MSSTTRPENGRSNRLTIRQVADLAGVSTATVSRVINGRTEVSDRAGEAVLRLRSLSRRRIAAITGPRGWIATEERLRGYRGALAAAGVMPAPELVVESDFHAEGGVEAALSLLDLPDPPTAVFAFNDMLAIGAMQAARVRGIRIPDDLSVVGFDDTSEASTGTPSLTAVRQALADTG